jgi:hypothetical protein
VPADGTSAANYESGDFGTSPFFGQLSGKHLPTSSYVTVVPRSKHNRGREIRLQHLGRHNMDQLIGDLSKVHGELVAQGWGGRVII